MLVTETHKNFPCGSKGRLTIKSDAGEVLAVIMTPVQKARKFCEANPESEQGKQFAAALVVIRRVDLKGQQDDLETAVADDEPSAIEELLRFQNDNADELLALGLRSTASAPAATSIPAPPVLLGANPDNTALISAQRKLVKLHEAAQGADPVQALNGIHTSRGNKYLNTCDDYRTVLLAHFAQGVVRG
jgi:hypothetical protein